MNNTIKISKNFIGTQKKMAIGFVIIIFSIQQMIGLTALPKVVPPSPDASSFGKFADMLVGFYTGDPDKCNSRIIEAESYNNLYPTRLLE